MITRYNHSLDWFGISIHLNKESLHHFHKYVFKIHLWIKVFELNTSWSFAGQSSVTTHAVFNNWFDIQPHNKLMNIAKKASFESTPRSPVLFSSFTIYFAKIVKLDWVKTLVAEARTGNIWTLHFKGLNDLESLKVLKI